MKVVNIYLSENAVVDSQENLLSLFNILDDISSPNFPLFVPRLSVTCVLEEEPIKNANFDCFIVCKLNGNEIQRFPFRITFRGSLRARTILKINGFLISSPGTIDFELEHENIALQKTSMIVRLIEKPIVEQS